MEKYKTYVWNWWLIYSSIESILSQGHIHIRFGAFIPLLIWFPHLLKLSAGTLSSIRELFFFFFFSLSLNFLFILFLRQPNNHERDILLKNSDKYFWGQFGHFISCGGVYLVCGSRDHVSCKMHKFWSPVLQNI